MIFERTKINLERTKIKRYNYGIKIQISTA